MSNAEELFTAAIRASLQKQYGDKPFAAEKALGLPQDSIRSLFRGTRKAGTSLNRAKELCDLFGLEFYIGPRRLQASAEGFAEAAKDYITLDGSRDELQAGYLPLPFHPADLAHKDLSHIAMSRAWIARAGLDPAHLSAVVMPDDDMRPSIEAGQLLLVDSRFRPEPDPMLCAMRIGSHLRVGWLVLPLAGCLVAFFERSYTPPLVQRGKTGPQIECLGRIAARLDDNPAPLIDDQEKRRLYDMAKRLAGEAPR